MAEFVYFPNPLDTSPKITLHGEGRSFHLTHQAVGVLAVDIVRADEEGRPFPPEDPFTSADVGDLLSRLDGTSRYFSDDKCSIIVTRQQGRMIHYALRRAAEDIERQRLLSGEVGNSPLRQRQAAMNELAGSIKALGGLATVDLE
jgi:hypothetical protein